MTLGDILANGRADYPNNVALKTKNQKWTYQEIDAQTNVIAKGLKKLGIGKGDRVSILMPNSPYFVLGYFGIVKLGAVTVPVNVMFKEQEIAHLLNDSGAVALYTVPAFVPLIQSIASELPSLKSIIVVDTIDSPSDKNTDTFDNQEDSKFIIASLREILNSGEEELNLNYEVKDNDTASFLYTSGTTGRPKGAMLTHRNLVYNAYQARLSTELKSLDVALCVLPMFHSFAWTTSVLMPLSAGASVIIMDSFMPQPFLKTVVEEKVTFITAVPTMFTMLLQVPDISPQHFSNVRLAYSGGASLPGEVLKKFNEKLGLKIIEGYGLSECSPVCTANPCNGICKAGSIGKPLQDIECKIIDEDGNQVPVNTPGELLFRGPNIMKGYFNMPEETAKVLKDGWLHTGDIGYMDEEGYLYIVDRKKDLIIAGGLNVYPREIEEVLYSHPKVAEAAVIGMPDPLRGEIIKAFIALKNGESATSREFIKYCQERLANYKLPKVVEFVDSLPKNSTGKILKRALKNYI